MSKSRRITVACLSAAALLTASAAAASHTSHAIYWKNKVDTYDCGFAAHPAGKAATLMLCSADAVPQPKGVPHDGDPADELGAHGKPKLFESHDSSYQSDGKGQVALPTNSKWSGVGVTCTIGAKNVTCKNKDKHGFTMGHKTYKTF